MSAVYRYGLSRVGYGASKEIDCSMCATTVLRSASEARFLTDVLKAASRI
jgi:hypothetical protein